MGAAASRCKRPAWEVGVRSIRRIGRGFADSLDAAAGTAEMTRSYSAFGWLCAIVGLLAIIGGLAHFRGACPRFCVTGPQAGDCHLTRRHHEPTHT
ncbi:hypothetical protein XFF6991_310100 [Xanthomonas phaseoli pv. phaseoli]|uniref:Uncharacterized protein n=1 Tax=Xanthomonas campestris pv. phaseoli TaxID=317013 RepID=A0A7Z7IYF1_XANCH|nr:hypothetical protein XFF6991_310100 [Xanthomonas phaseoli pv. phaseoli]